MFICRACAKRATSNILQRRTLLEGRILSPSRTFATNLPIRRGNDHDNDIAWAEGEPGAQPNIKNDQNGTAKSDRRAFLRQVDKDKAVTKLKRQAKMHLRTLDDPFHVAADVKRTLERGEYDKAMAITREASRTMQVVVSWNYLIVHLFKKQRLHAAIKLYNEMKKRSQLPNAQTYTAIFAGCARSEHPQAAVNEAVKIYNTMLTSARLKPNIIHLNAVLEVCSRAEEIETMFTLLKSATDNRSPNNFTYTTIINALRMQPSNYRDAMVDPKDEDEAIEFSRRTTIQRAKAVWEEVIGRWRKAQITVDEELTCAMGRTLLLGRHQDIDDCLTLMEQVMGIPKFDENGPKLPQGENKGNGKMEGDGPKPPTSEDRDMLLRMPDNLRPRPGNNTLSLLMIALGKARRTKLASKYWDHLTLQHQIVPDHKNWTDYLNTLITGNASGKAARAISAMRPEDVAPTFIKKALTICTYDLLNDNAFDNATMIIERMLRVLRVPEPKCMELYLQVAMGNSKKFFDSKRSARNPQASKFAYGRQIMDALDRLWDPLRAATNDMSYPTQNTASPEEAWRLNQPERKKLLELAQKIVAANDKIITEGLAQADDIQMLKSRRNVMNMYVQRARRKNEQFGPLPGIDNRRKNRRHADAA